jgi:hypothetical protein
MKAYVNAGAAGEQWQHYKTRSNRTVQPHIDRLMLRCTLSEFIFGPVNEKLLWCLAA